ncbi:HlyD family type I secretion periplasmic adaptor subunit [Photobacterium galatheae]|uniref:Membrane fusion protein (MFP) family protein n=1 Tax=Photobacterium galatheae TaxID=1654360 RepID=A0A066RRN1_9GAMM|nr:HlyD family type I secretion periplasmic adaptor subunit [Photobacterium galatheae]KDM91756.1 hypothetical protein EA58_09600 [Photobacterium galatheae]MCM0147151.1 HlyD family type I secretion periplasmic adaptor subunit [Photobacterium galatheae]
MFNRWLKRVAKVTMEPEFSPAMVRLQQRPPAIAAQCLIGVVCALALAVGLWATLGTVNILVTGYGKVETVTHMTRIQPVAVGKIRRLLVEEGEHVDAGQLLLELDTTEFDVDKQHLERKLAYQQIIIERLAMTDRAFRDGHWVSQPLSPVPSLEPEFIEHQQLKMASDILSYFADLAQYDSQVTEKQAELAELNALISKLEQLLTISTEQEQAKRVLSEQKLFSRLDWLEERRNLIADEQELVVLRQRVGRMNASIQQIQQEKKSFQARKESQLAAERLSALEALSTAREELKRMNTRIAHSLLHAPVSGVVHQLQAYRAGEVLVEAQPVMQIIPDQTPLEVVVYVPNKDIGFIQEGVKAIVKVESYPYTQYGTLSGVVKNISPDTIELNQAGFFYEVKITLDQQAIPYQGRELTLSPGMAVMAEMKTGKRKMIDYFLSPLIEMKDSAFSER